MAKFYGMGPSGYGYSGMDDAGEMSAWYVFSAAGLYPLSAADARYLVTAPVFNEVRWQVDKDKVLTVKKPTAGRNLSAVKVNGMSNAGYFVPYALFRSGGEIEIITN